MALIGNEIFQVTGITGSGLPSGQSLQTTTLQTAQVAGFSAMSLTPLVLTTNATLTQVPNLSVNLTAGNTYIFQTYLSIASSSGGGIAINLGQGTTVAASFTADTWIYNTTTLSAQGNTTTLTNYLPTYGGVATVVNITGTIKPTTTGTFAVYAAQTVSGTASSTTINVGSYLDMTRIS